MLRSLSGKVFTRSRTQEWTSFPDEEGGGSSPVGGNLPILSMSRLSARGSNYFHPNASPIGTPSSPRTPKISRSRSGSEVLRRLERSFSLKSNSGRRRKSSMARDEFPRNQLGGSSEQWVAIHGSTGSSGFLNRPGSIPMLNSSNNNDDEITNIGHFGTIFHLIKKNLLNIKKNWVLSTNFKMKYFFQFAKKYCNFF